MMSGKGVKPASPRLHKGLYHNIAEAAMHIHASLYDGIKVTLKKAGVSRQSLYKYLRLLENG